MIRRGDPPSGFSFILLQYLQMFKGLSRFRVQELMSICYRLWFTILVPFCWYLVPCQKRLSSHPVQWLVSEGTRDGSHKWNKVVHTALHLTQRYPASSRHLTRPYLSHGVLITSLTRSPCLQFDGILPLLFQSIDYSRMCWWQVLAKFV